MKGYSKRPNSLSAVVGFDELGLVKSFGPTLTYGPGPVLARPFRLEESRRIAILRQSVFQIHLPWRPAACVAVVQTAEQL